MIKETHRSVFALLPSVKNQPRNSSVRVCYLATVYSVLGYLGTRGLVSGRTEFTAVCQVPASSLNRTLQSSEAVPKLTEAYRRLR